MGVIEFAEYIVKDEIECGSAHYITEINLSNISNKKDQFRSKGTCFSREKWYFTFIFITFFLIY